MDMIKLAAQAGRALAAAPGTVEALTPDQIKQVFNTYGLNVESANLEQYETAPEGVLIVKFNLFGTGTDLDLKFDLPDVMAEIATKLGADSFNSLRTDPYSVTFVFDEGGLTWGSKKPAEEVTANGTDLVIDASFGSELVQQLLNDLEQHVPKEAFKGMTVHNTKTGGRNNYEVFVPKSQWFPKGLYIHEGDAADAADAKAQALLNVLRRYEANDTEFISDGQVT